MCGLAQTLDQMILFRLLQGAFGAALSPLSQAIIIDRYPLEKRGQIMAVWSMIIMLGPILGPTLGGFLTDHYSWRWVFYVNVPVGIVSTAGVFLFLHEARHDTPPRFDWFGFIALSIGLGALQLMLDRGTTNDWFDSRRNHYRGRPSRPRILYLHRSDPDHQQTVPAPRSAERQKLSLGPGSDIFRGNHSSCDERACCRLTCRISAAIPCLDTGLLLAPRGVGTMVTMLFVGRIVMRVDPRKLMAFGASILIWSLWEMSRWTPDIDTPDARLSPPSCKA